jgi:Carboxypeptidase regulatory-like domain
LRVCNVNAKVSSQILAMITCYMQRRSSLLFCFIPCSALTLAQQRGTSVAALSVSCEPDSDALRCRAVAMADEHAEPHDETDMTNSAEWSTSNVKTANIVRGRVTAREPGTATIAATVRSGDQTVSSSVLVVVDAAGARPQIAYDLKGVVRALSNDGLANVELTLVDDQDRARSTVTSGADGAFRIVPLLNGQYRLRATKPGYRPAERLVSVPDAAPLTLVLLNEPR